MLKIGQFAGEDRANHLPHPETRRQECGRPALVVRHSQAPFGKDQGGDPQEGSPKASGGKRHRTDGAGVDSDQDADSLQGKRRQKGRLAADASGQVRPENGRWNGGKADDNPSVRRKALKSRRGRDDGDNECRGSGIAETFKKIGHCWQPNPAQLTGTACRLGCDGWGEIVFANQDHPGDGKERRKGPHSDPGTVPAADLIKLWDEQPAQCDAETDTSVQCPAPMGKTVLNKRPTDFGGDDDKQRDTGKASGEPQQPP